MDPSDPAPSQITSVSDPYSLDPDPAKILNLGKKKLKLLHIIRYSHQKKSIER